MLVSIATRCRFFHHTAIFGLSHRKPDLLIWHFVPVSSFREHSLALPWQPGEHKKAWNQRPHITYFHSCVLRRLNHIIFTVIQLELIQVQCDPLTSILQIQTWNLLTLLIEEAATTQSIFNEWMVHSSFHEAPLGNAIVHFKLHFVIMSLFSHSTSSYLLIDSHDVQAAFQGILEFHSFSRPSRASTSVGTYPAQSHPMGLWVGENPMGWGDYHQTKSFCNNRRISWVL